MFGISHLLSRIQNVFLKETLARSCIAKIISNTIGVDVPVESVSIKGSTILLLNTSQSMRTAIFIKKQAILKEFAANEETKNFLDIR
ncbi:MAG: hypothetical protein WC648_03990 [Candidatus Paceibacterota bacterium]|jgi:hypothetical protein